MWRLVCLRSSGFPVSQLRGLATEELAAAVDALAEGDSSARARVEELATQARRAVGRAARRAAADPRMREATLWSNPDVVRIAWDGLLANDNPDDTSSRTRQREGSVVRYLQRYSTKNDSIGFFGPIGWARLDPDEPRAIRMRAGPALTAERRVYLEPWAAREIAAALAEMPEVREHLGHAGIIVPVDVVDTFAFLESTIASMPEPARGVAHAWFAPFAEAFRALGTGCMPPGELDAALSRIDAAFLEVTRSPASHRSGEMYAGRRVLYLDTRRDVELVLGAPVLRALAPLSLVMQASRWLCSELARRFAARVGREFDALRGETGSAVVEYAALEQRLADFIRLPRGPVHPETAEVLKLAQARWASVLELDARDGTARSYTMASLAPRVAEMFDAPSWDSAVLAYHSPDIAIAARDKDAIERGEFTVVLAEMHVADNTIMQRLFVKLLPEFESARAAYAADLRGRRIVRRLSEPRGRNAHPPLYRPEDLVLETGSARVSRDGREILAPADLVARRDDRGDVVFETRDGRLRLSLGEMFGSWISFALFNEFPLLPDAGKHRPRITIDRFVLARESWHFDAADLAFAHAKTPLDRFIATRRWARAHGLPRFIFYKSPREVKPIYADIASTASVEVLCHIARATDTLHVSEMLPTPEETWLEDAEGERYTSELRLACIDTR